MNLVRLGVLVMVFGLLATHAAFAEQDNIYKTVASQKISKTGGNGPSASSSGLGSSSVAAPKSGKLGGSSQGAKKNSSYITGTGFHRKR